MELLSQLRALPLLPPNLDVEEINISFMGETKLPDLSRYTKLKKLSCDCNELTQLDNLPSTLLELDCSNNQITSLDNLKQSLEILFCVFNLKIN